MPKIIILLLVSILTVMLSASIAKAEDSVESASEEVKLDSADKISTETIIFRPNIPPIDRSMPEPIIEEVVEEKVDGKIDSSFLSDAAKLSTITDPTTKAIIISARERLRLRRIEEENRRKKIEADLLNGIANEDGEPIKRGPVILNINTATVQQLLSIPELSRMDERRARAIVQYRTTHGKFKYLDDLSQVFGINDSHVDQWRSRMKIVHKSSPIIK